MHRAFVASSLLLLQLGGQASGAPMETCGEQKDCITFTMTEAVPAATCAGTGAACEWTVCLELNLHDAVENPTCVKAGTDTVSHTCVRDAATCTPTLWPAGAEVGSIPNEFSQCQTGAGGEQLTFLLKDGQGCDAAGLVGDTITAGIPAGSAVTCAPRTSAFASCTGNAVGKECVWTVTLPTCEVPDETPSPPRDYKCPKGKNVCYTDDCQCVMGSCTPYNGAAALQDVLVGYDPAANVAGAYAVSGTCENGKALSNAVRIVDASTCEKEEPAGADTAFLVTVDAAGNVLTPFSMKCGKDCFLYGPFAFACN